jgi:hypothetical protein
VDPVVWIQAAAVIVPAAVHLSFLQNGYSGKQWSASVADVVIGGLLILGGFGYLHARRPAEWRSCDWTVSPPAKSSAKRGG